MNRANGGVRRCAGVALTSAALLGACGGSREPAAPPRTPPAAQAPRARCPVITSDGPLRAADAKKTLDELAAHIQLAPEDEALRKPKSLDDVRNILRRDAVYLFDTGATFARASNSLDGRFLEATLELLLGESQLVASPVLTLQAAWVAPDLRVARASLATDEGMPANDRDRMLSQLVRVVEEGNKISDALGIVGPMHVARGAELARALRAEAPNDPRTQLLAAEYHAPARRDTGRAFFLAAAIFANPDEVMNDDLYAYDTIAFPVLADVGEVFTRHGFD